MSASRQVDLTTSHPMQMAWVVADTLHILSAQGVQAVPIPTMDKDTDNAMDIMEVSQPELLVSFEHPAVASYLAGDMTSLVVVQDNQVMDRLVVATVCTVNWSVKEVFSREKLLWQLDLPKDTSSKLYHIPYNNIKMWTDLSTTPGIMAAFSKEELLGRVVAKSPLPITLVCDNIRQPVNLVAVLRVAAAAGAQQVVLTPGCVDAWAPKVVRAGAGAHFLVPVVEGVGWDTLAGRWPMLVLADLVHGEQEGVKQVVVDRMLEELENATREEGRVMAYQNQELCERYRELPVRTKNYSEFELDPGY